ncbi:MAG: serine/threonine-protein kinase, partial [Planctomycetota bacterium]
GGQGSVYLAKDTRIKGRRVALKVLPPGTVVSEALMRRFRREAEIASRLDHPGICTVFGADVDREVPYIAMRYIPGKPLSDWIEARRKERILESAEHDPTSGVHLPFSEQDKRGTGRAEMLRVTAFVEDAARALYTAHQAGLVHRDIKPGNLMVTPDGKPVLLDFGLAQDSDQGQTLTMTGVQIGTPAYMAPEQIVTDEQTLDARADVYAMGVTLFEALTLRRPFEAHTRDALYQKILRDDAESPRSWNPAVTKDLEVVTLTALEKSPDRRYQTAQDLADDLARVVRGEPVKARPIGPLRRMARVAMRNPARSIAASAIFLLLFGAFGISQYYLAELVEVRRQSDEAQAELLHVRTAPSDRPDGESMEETVRARIDSLLEQALVVLENPGSASAKDVESARRSIAEELWVRAFSLHRDGETERATELLARVLQVAGTDERLGALLRDVVTNIAEEAGDAADAPPSVEAELLETLLEHESKPVALQAENLHAILVPPVEEPPTETNGETDE